MSSYTKCHNLAEFHKVKYQLELIQGMVYVPSQRFPPHAGVNYVKQHGFLFSTCSEHEFNQNTESDESNI